MCHNKIFDNMGKKTDKITDTIKKTDSISTSNLNKTTERSLKRKAIKELRSVIHDDTDIIKFLGATAALGIAWEFIIGVGAIVAAPLFAGIALTQISDSGYIDGILSGTAYGSIVGLVAAGISITFITSMIFSAVIGAAAGGAGVYVGKELLDSDMLD